MTAVVEIGLGSTVDHSDPTGAVLLQAAPGAALTLRALAPDGSVAISLVLGTDGSLTVVSATGQTFSLGTSISSSGDVWTAGWGVPAIFARARLAGQTAAVANVASQDVGPADASFYISANVDVTAYTSGTFSVVVNYTNRHSVAKSLVLNFSNPDGVSATRIAALDTFSNISTHIVAKADTTLTVATVGTFTSLTYDIETVIAKMA